MVIRSGIVMMSVLVGSTYAGQGNETYQKYAGPSHAGPLAITYVAAATHTVERHDMSTSMKSAADSSAEKAQLRLEYPYPGAVYLLSPPRPQEQSHELDPYGSMFP